MHADVDDAAVGGTVEESRDAPWLIAQRMHDLKACCLDSPKRLVDVVDEDRYVGVDGSGGVLGHHAELVAVDVSEGDDPTVIHQDPEAEHGAVVPHGGREVGHRQIRDHSIDMHMPIVAATAEEITALDARAEREGKSRSEVIREALARAQGWPGSREASPLL